jgi:hypothetical protein
VSAFGEHRSPGSPAHLDFGQPFAYSLPPVPTGAGTLLVTIER